jgi:hypothetical protein
LLPLAAEGLAAWNIDRGDRDRLLTIIEQRCLKRQTGASWQVAMRRHLLGRGMSPEKATLAMVREYRDGMVSGEPVHTWALP